MLKIEAVARVVYTCELSDEDEQKVLQHIKNNPDEFEFMSAKDKLIKAIDELYTDCEIELYESSVESDCSTEEIKWSEFEERKAEDILED